MNINTRLLIKLTFILTLTFSLAACTTTGKTPSVPETNGKVHVYEVFGMNCPACHGGLVKQAKKIPGVTSAEADWKAKTLTITVEKDQAVADNKVNAAIKRANFTPGKRLK